MKFMIAVYARPEDQGEAVFLGQTSVLADTESDARARAIAELWDERLTCASCSAEARVLGAGAA